MKNILTLFMIVISSTAFAQAVKPCKCPDAGSSCTSDGGSSAVGIDLYGDAYVINRATRPYYDDGVPATYVVRTKMLLSDLDANKCWGTSYTLPNVGGWSLWTDSSANLNYANYPPLSGPSVSLTMAGYDAGTHTVCVTKDAANLYTLIVDGVSVTSATGGVQSGGDPNWLTRFSDSSAAFEGVMYFASFFYGAALTPSQCGQLHDGGLTINNFTSDAGMELGFIFNGRNNNLNNLSPVAPLNAQNVELYGYLKFSP